MQPQLTREYKTIYCNTCECKAVICPTCGNNTCNGGYGRINTGRVDEKECPDCPAAYDEATRLGLLS